MKIKIFYFSDFIFNGKAIILKRKGPTIRHVHNQRVINVLLTFAKFWHKLN